MSTILRRFVLAFILILSFQPANGQPYPQNDFRSPLDIPIILSGTFGELRGNHFHAGIDIKTNGVEGLNVYAVADGQVVRVAVSPFGYGNALYIRHDNGYTSVYAHLQKFNPQIQAYVEEQQYEQKSFSVNLFPGRGKFRVAQGDIIALSGNSGGSGGPHVHFEIRDSRTEEPINPLLFGYHIPDHRSPDIQGIYAYPLDNDSHLNEQHERLSLAYRHTGKDAYSVRWKQRGWGQIGFAIVAKDRLDQAWNANGPYRIAQYIDDELTYVFTVERFAFSESRYLNAHIDYELSHCCNKMANRTWILPGNHLRSYSEMKNSGILTIDSTRTYNIRWEISDVAGNVTTLTCQIEGTRFEDNLPKTPSGIAVLFDEPSGGEWDGFEWKMDENTLYTNAVLEQLTSQGPAGTYGFTYTLGSRGMPVHKYLKVELPAQDVPAKYRQQALVVGWNADGSPDPWKSRLHGNRLSARVRALGDFSVMVDSTAPEIFPGNINRNRTIRTGQVLNFTITDDLSGLDRYQCEIDGNWHLMSYDAKNHLMQVQIGQRYTPGKHSLRISATDEAGNTNVWTSEIEVIP